MNREGTSSMSRTAICSIAAACLATAGSTTAAENDAFKLHIEPSIMHDSNLFRLSDSVDNQTALGSDHRDDIIKAFGLGADADLHFGRQRFTADVLATRYRFTNFSYLDYTGAQGQGVFFWQFGNDLSGRLSWNGNRALSDFSDFRTPAQNVLTTQNRSLYAAYRLGASYQLRAEAGKYTSRNSTSFRVFDNIDQDAWTIGVDYLPASGNRIGLQVRRLTGEFPNRPSVAASAFEREFTENNYEAAADIRFSGISHVAGAFGYTHRTRDNGASFSGPTANLRYDWTPTGKSEFNFLARRQIQAYETVTTSFAVTNSLSAQWNWLVTSKLTAVLGDLVETRKFLGDTGVFIPGLAQRRDRTNTLTAGAHYQQTPDLQFGFDVNHQRRTTNAALFDFNDTTATLSARLLF